MIGLVVVASAVLASCGPSPAPAPSDPPPTEPITLGHGRVAGNGSASGASLSADGVWTAFTSAADNLVAGDTNGLSDLFLRNNRTGTVQRIVSHVSADPRISRNGRYVGYVAASGPGTGTYGVYDRASSTTTTWTDHGSLSVPAVTDDGTTAILGAGSSFGIFAVNCRIRDLVAGSTSDCPHGSAEYGTVALSGTSGNGRYAMYFWNDQSGGGTSGWRLHDVVSDTTTTLTGDFVGLGISNVVSDDGTTIFAGGFGVALPVSVHDVATATSTPFPGMPDGNGVPLGISPGGRFLALHTDATNLDPTDTNGLPDVYVWDRDTDAVTLVSRALDTGQLIDEYGVDSCGTAVGQIDDRGRVCIMGTDDLSASFANGAIDAYRTAALD